MAITDLLNGLDPTQSQYPKLAVPSSPQTPQANPVQPVATNPVPKVARLPVAPAAKIPQPGSAPTPAPAANAGDQPFEQYLRGQIISNASAQDALGPKLDAELESLKAERENMKAEYDAKIAEHMKNKPPPIESFNYQPKDVSDMAGMLMVLAALGGSLTRAPLTASLNNMAAMIKGFNEGNQTAFEQAYKQFDANFKKGTEAHRAYQDELAAIREQHRGDLANLTEAIRELDLKYGKKESLLSDRGKTLMELQKALTDESTTVQKGLQEALRYKAEQDRFALGLKQADLHERQLQALIADRDQKNQIAQERVTEYENQNRRRDVLTREGLWQKHADSVAAAEKKLSGPKADEHGKVMARLIDEYAQGKMSKQKYEEAVDMVNAQFGVALPAQGAAPAPSRVKATSAPPPGFEPD